MIKIYTTPSCASCRKAKKWLDDHELKYIEKNIFAQKLTKEEIRLMLSNTENGFDDLISKRSKYLIEHPIDEDTMKTSELEQLIIDHPSILKRPIIVEDKKLQVGYNEDEIRVFIPRELRDAMQCVNCDSHELSDKLKKYYYEQRNIKK